MIRAPRVVPGGAAETDGRLQIGDQVMEVNGTSVYEMSHIAITDLLKTCGDKVSYPAIECNGQSLRGWCLLTGCLCYSKVTMWVVSNATGFTDYIHQVDVLRSLYTKTLLGLRKVLCRCCCYLSVFSGIDHSTVCMPMFVLQIDLPPIIGGMEELGLTLATTEFGVIVAAVADECLAEKHGIVVGDCIVQVRDAH